MKKIWIIPVILVPFAAGIILGNMYSNRVKEKSERIFAEATSSTPNAFRMNAANAGKVHMMRALETIALDQGCTASCCAQKQNPEADMKQKKTDSEKKESAEVKMGALMVKKPDSTATAKLSGLHTCPMDSHSDVIQYGPGKCSKCGMELVPVEKTSGRTFYVCPMPQDSVVSSKAGNCPKCGMKLVEKTIAPVDIKTETADSLKSAEKSAKQEANMVFTCPMNEHADVIQMGPGQCPKCGMELVPVEKTSKRTFYVCPMPKDQVVSSKPGKCPKCGMLLTKKTVTGKPD